ncbi:MAG: S-layer protein [Elainellaceae cyanobacterium]
MQFRYSLSVAMAIALSANLPVFAQTAERDRPSELAQAEPSAQQVVDACVSGEVETLPNPYTDVTPDHWVYEAVLTMYYCGVIRPGLPPTVVERVTGIRPSFSGDR